MSYEEESRATESEFQYHEPCPSCGSSDNLGRFSDGHAWCFGCGYREPPTDGEERTSKPDQTRPKDLINIEVRALSARKLTEETCQKFGYGVGEFKGKTVQVAQFREDGKIVAQKLRSKDKKFTWLGSKPTTLFGQHLWRDTGKKVIITEGEIDCMTISQLQGNKWPVVSVKNGAQGAKKCIKQQLEWLSQFEEVVLCFDNDEAGQDAVADCAPLFKPGTCKVATLPLKDANEMLKAGRGKEVINALWDAKVFRPDGIIDGLEITLEELMKPQQRGFPCQYPKLEEKLHGIRKGELHLFTAGSGVGKSTMVRELGWYFNRQLKLRTGNIYLEENYRKTARSFIAIDNDVPLGILNENPQCIPKEQYEGSHKELVQNGRTFFYNHFGSLESDRLLAKLRYFAVSLDCDFIMLDHISIVVSGQESSREGERKDIDKLMTSLRSLVEETGVGVIAIVHLKQPEGKSHEEGGRVTLSQLRGSGSLKQLSDNVIALERNQQSKGKSDISTVRVLKNREFGDLGVADTLSYSHSTGRLEATSDVDFDEDDDGDDNSPF